MLVRVTLAEVHILLCLLLPKFPVSLVDTVDFSPLRNIQPTHVSSGCGGCLRLCCSNDIVHAGHPEEKSMLLAEIHVCFASETTHVLMCGAL